MGVLTYSTGTTAGDHKGDDLKAILDAIKAAVNDLIGGGGGTTSVTVTAASGSANNVDPGSGFPSSIAWLDVDTSAGAATWTGLKAGTEGQTVAIRVTGANTLTLSTGGDGLGDALSSAVNRFTGENDAAILTNGITHITYKVLPAPTWAIG